MALKHIFALVCVGMALTGCQRASEHMADVRQAQDGDKLTMGKVQREIRVGMSSAQVAEVLGSPNMVTTDDKRRESWVYDKVSTESVFSTSSGGVNALLLGSTTVGNGVLSGLGGPNYQSATGARSTTQRTLTIIIKYDEAGKVRDFSYRSSSF